LHGVVDHFAHVVVFQQLVMHADAGGLLHTAHVHRGAGVCGVGDGGAQQLAVGSGFGLSCEALILEFHAESQGVMSLSEGRVWQCGVCTAIVRATV
jgi:hypothetical protein